ncbi:MAG: hypothetical protein K2J40_09255 [Ruminococcus sp.]|nr:hypothetical protein [Ruminococcus sp.]
MTYSSLLFIYGFLPLSLLVYRIAPASLKHLSLFVLSCVFCTLNSLRFMYFMLVYTVVNYFAGLFIGKFRKRKSLSAIPLSLGVSFDLLIFFMFRTDCLDVLREKSGIPEEFFPLGISFATLTAVGYLIDIFRKRMKPEFNFIKFALYMMFFPKLFIIVRYKTFYRMLGNKKVTLADIGDGFRIFVRGLAKKVIAGDTMYMLYMAVRSIDIWKMSAVNGWIGMTAYLLCVYFVLSGIADMGMGIGYCFGFRLPQSFNYPVFRTKIRDFALNWHVQIIYWFRRYFSKPLYEAGKNRLYKNIVFITAWCLAGLWYRFDPNGFMWGFLIGLTVVLEKYLRRFRFLKVTGIIYTYVITIICMVFLSGEDITQSVNYLLVMLGGNSIFADSVTLYLLKYYIIMLLICMYFSTSLFRNLLMRPQKNCLKNIISAISPVITVILLVICTILISYTGSSETFILKL